MPKIMLVEDDNNLSEIYQARMMAEGYTVVTAHDGEEALALAAKEKPDLIISDVMMPKISGFEMLDILRNTQGLKDTKVIMLTALGQAEDKTRADALGADRYLVKSQVTLEDIVKSVQELLNPGVPAGSTTPAPQAASAPTPTPSTTLQPPIAAPAGPPAQPPADVTAPSTTPAPTPTAVPTTPVVAAPASVQPTVAPAMPTQPAPSTPPAHAPGVEPAPVASPTTPAPAPQATIPTAPTPQPVVAPDQSIPTTITAATQAVTPSAPAATPANTAQAPAVATADDKLVSNAVNDLLANTPQATAAKTTAPQPEPAQPVAPVAPTPQPVEPTPAPTPKVPSTQSAAQESADIQNRIADFEHQPQPPATAPASDGDNVPIAHKKVIQPISTPSAKPDLNSLLAAEEAKNPATATAPPAVVIGSESTSPATTPQPSIHQPGNVVTPVASGVPTPKSETGIDPNSIAL